MVAKIKTWGNSQGVRLPKEILQTVGLKVDDEVEIEVENGIILLSRRNRHRTLEERALAYGGHLNLDGEFDWGEDVGSEVWK